MIRFLLVAIVLLGFLVLGSPLLLFEWILGKVDPERRDRQCQCIVRGMFRFILWLSGTKLVVEGRENIPQDRAVLFVGNHRSYFDILTTYLVMERKTGYIAKKEMERYPLLKNWMHNIGCLFLNRQDIKEGLKTILQAIGDIKGGTSLVIYPEGTRNRGVDGAPLLMEYKEGSMKIAEKAKCPVVPMAELGTAEIFEKHMPFIRPAKVVLRFGKPFYTAELPEEFRKKPAAYAKARIEEMLMEMQKEYPDIRI